MYIHTHVHAHIRTRLTISFISFINPSMYMYMYIQVRYAMYTCMYNTCTYIQYTLVQYMYICLHILTCSNLASKETCIVMNNPKITVSRADLSSSALRL